MLLTGSRRFQVAVSRFIDDVSILAIEDCLVSKLSTLFRSSNVLEMSAQDISRLAGETRESSLERQRLEAKRKILKTGLQSLKSLNKRRNVVNPTEQHEVVTEDSQQMSAMTPSRSEKASTATNSTEAALRATIPDEPSYSPDRVEIPPPPSVDEWPPQGGFDGHMEDFWARTHMKKKKASRKGTVESMFEKPLVNREWE